MDTAIIKALSELLDEKLAPIKQDISGMKQDIAHLSEKVEGMRKDLATVEVVTARNMANIAQLKIIK